MKYIEKLKNESQKYNFWNYYFKLVFEKWRYLKHNDFNKENNDILTELSSKKILKQIYIFISLKTIKDIVSRL